MKTGESIFQTGKITSFVSLHPVFFISLCFVLFTGGYLCRLSKKLVHENTGLYQQNAGYDFEDCF